MPTTDEQLQAKRDEISRLREAIAAAEADNARKVQEAANDATMQALTEEQVRLEKRLAEVTGQDAPPAGPAVDQGVIQVESGAHAAPDDTPADQNNASDGTPSDEEKGL